jgi:hypothetical protein
MLCLTIQQPRLQEGSSIVQRALALKDKIWKHDITNQPMTELNVVVFGGNSEQRQWVKYIIENHLQPYVYIKLIIELIDNVHDINKPLYKNYHIRCALTGTPQKYIDSNLDNQNGNKPYTVSAAWSKVGTDALRVKHPYCTMYLGYLDDYTTRSLISMNTGKVIIHEFLHALGFLHEQAHPRVPIEWNKKKVYEYFEGPPNKWNTPEIDLNVFKTFQDSQVESTDYDKLSIMHYYFPNELIENYDEIGSIPINTHLSSKDIELLGRLYGEGVYTEYQFDIDKLLGYRYISIIGVIIGIIVAIPIYTSRSFMKILAVISFILFVIIINYLVLKLT